MFLKNNQSKSSLPEMHEEQKGASTLQVKKGDQQVRNAPIAHTHKHTEENYKIFPDSKFSEPKFNERILFLNRRNFLTFFDFFAKLPEFFYSEEK